MKSILLVLYNYFMLFLFPFKIKTKVYTDKELIDIVKQKKLSLIRFGDGEYRIMFSKKGIHYQEYNDDLRKELLAIFDDYGNNKDKYIICIPKFFTNGIKWFFKNKREYIMCFSKPRLFFRLMQNKNTEYGDAFIFSKGKEKIYENLWMDKENIIIVHNDKKWADYFNKKYQKNVIFIKTKPINSYDIINDIEEKLLNVKGVEKYLVLISSGPMAKVLSYRLTQRNIQVIDTGHCFDDPLV